MTTDFEPCPECGQMITILIDKHTTIEQRAALALLGCSCPKGREAALIKQQVDEAKLNIEQLCGLNADGTEQPTNVNTIDFLKKSVDLIAVHEILGVTVKLSGNTKVVISTGSKEQIKVSKTTSTSEILESNKRY